MRRALVLLLSTGLLAAAACTSDQSAPPTTAVSSELAAGEFAFPAGQRWPDATWAGKVDGTDAFIALVAGTDGLIAYVCDNAATGQWFRSDSADGTVVAGNDSGGLLTATLAGDQVTGSVVVPGAAAAPFSAARADTGALYRAEGFDEDQAALAGWVTLPSGERRGTIGLGPRVGGTPTITAGPALDPNQSLTVAKSITSPVPTLQIPPPNPLTPDTLASPTPNGIKFVWTAMGDSYASGEGAPVAGGSFAPGFIPLSLPKWGPDSESQATKDERQACHRSTKAGAPVANERLKQDFPDVTFEFIHVACSGAETFDIMNGGYDGPDRGVRVVQPAQGQRAAEFAAGKGAYDAAYLSIGGNDAGFGDVIAGCLTKFKVDALGLRDCQDDPPVRAADQRSGRPARTIAQSVASLPGAYRSIDTYLRSSSRPARPRNILASKYPDPTKGENGQDCGDGNGHLSGDLLGLISTKEGKWARDDVLEAGMNAGVAGTTELGWLVVDGHLPLFANHGICATNHFFNTNNDALPRQGDDFDTPGTREAVVAAAAFVAAAAAASTVGGILLAPTLAIVTAIATAALVNISAGLVHPNVDGFAAYATGIADKIRPLVDKKLADGLRPPTGVRVASAVNNQDLTIRWNDKSTSEDRYEVTVTRLEGTGTVPAGVVRLPANAQELKVTSNGPVNARFEVKACVRNTCSEPGRVEGSNFVPAVPTGGTGSYIAVSVPQLNRVSAIAQASWTESPRALQYVVAYRQIDPAGSVNGQLTPRTPVGGVAIAEPSLGTTGNPKAVYGFKISACNRAGCSVFSPEVQADARGNPTVTVLDAGSQPRSPITELMVAPGNITVPGPSVPTPSRPGLGGPTPTNPPPTVPGPDPRNPNGGG